jgi:gluconokinase
VRGAAPQEVCIGLDAGTTGCKAVAVSATGHVRAEAAATYPLFTDATGAAEQEAADLWRAVRRVLTTLAQRLDGGRPVALALSGAMHSLLPLDRRGAPLGRATTWADTRATAALAELRRASPTGLYEVTGCPLAVPYHLARLRWLRAAEPAAFGRAAHFVSLKDWLGYRLTGALRTDLGYASTTGLLELRARRWSDHALELAGITPARLPELAEPTDLLGELERDTARACGLPLGLPVFVGSSDGALANVGAGVRRPGGTVLTVGTSGAVRRVTATPLLDPEARTWCYRFFAGHFLAGGAVNNGGLALEWVRRTLYGELPRGEGFSQLLKEAAAATADGLVVLPYLTGERSPHWNAAVRGAVFGLSDAHTRADLARAALEGVAFCLKDVWEVLAGSALGAKRPEGAADHAAQLTGGLSRSPVWAQLVADVLGTPLEVGGVADASAVGAAALAWTALRNSPLEHAPLPPEATGAAAKLRRFSPRATHVERYNAKFARFRALYAAVAGYAA